MHVNFSMMYHDSRIVGFKYAVTKLAQPQWRRKSLQVLLNYVQSRKNNAGDFQVPSVI